METQSAEDGQRTPSIQNNRPERQDGEGREGHRDHNAHRRRLTRDAKGIEEQREYGSP